MDDTLLKIGLVAKLGAVSGAALFLIGCEVFRDPVLELDPALLRDSTVQALPDSEVDSVLRRNVLESFGSFGCVSCPEAEAKLAPYIYADLDSPSYNPALMVVNYHVKFGTVNDLWVTPGTQARYDQSFANSLPQAVMDGSNAPFGIRENDVRYDQGEYDSLVARLGRLNPKTSLDLRIDTTSLAYDSMGEIGSFRFSVLNLGPSAETNLSFRVLAVKNLPVTHPLTHAIPWEVIVAETTTLDSSGRAMKVTALPARSQKTFAVGLKLTGETSKQLGTQPLGLENPVDYAIMVLVNNSAGLVRNAVAFRYHPRRS